MKEAAFWDKLEINLLQMLMLVPTLIVKSVWLCHNLKVIKLNRFIKMHLCSVGLAYSCSRQWRVFAEPCWSVPEFALCTHCI